MRKTSYITTEYVWRINEVDTKAVAKVKTTSLFRNVFAMGPKETEEVRGTNSQVLRNVLRF